MKTTQYLLGIYLSKGKYEYQKLLIPRDNVIGLLAMGDINGDGQDEVVFAGK